MMRNGNGYFMELGESDEQSTEVADLAPMGLGQNG